MYHYAISYRITFYSAEIRLLRADGENFTCTAKDIDTEQVSYSQVTDCHRSLDPILRFLKKMKPPSKRYKEMQKYSKIFNHIHLSILLTSSLFDRYDKEGD